MTPPAPILPTSNGPALAQSIWARWCILQLKLIKKNPGGGATKRLLLTIVLCVVVIFMFSIAVSATLPLPCGAI